MKGNVERTCQVCGAVFIGSFNSRYCPSCYRQRVRDLNREYHKNARIRTRILLDSFMDRKPTAPTKSIDRSVYSSISHDYEIGTAINSHRGTWPTWLSFKR